MSFYDDASLVFLPSGGAGKNGKVYSMKPVPEYGNELTTNGGFDTDSYWTKETGWSIANGKATQDGSAVGTGGAGDLVSGGTIFQIGKTYLIKIDIVDYVSGDLDVTSSNIPLSANKDGSYYTYYTAATAYLHIRAGYSAFIGSIDNVSVKEVIVGDADFTFSRGGDLTTATRVDSNGLIEKGRENLLSYSNEFATSPWGVNGLETPTTGESGYDGSTDAWLLETSASSGRLTRTTSLSGVNTFSFYAKKGNVNYIAFFGISSGSFPRAWFNLETGNVSNQLNHIDAKMEIIGNGWYRCSITFDEAVTELRIYPTNTAGSFSAGAGETSIIQDAQVEIGLVATEYIESGATTGKAGLLEDSPRFDYSGGASCPSLLLEPSRTQLVTQSEYFESSDWDASPSGVGIAADITTNYATSPEGLQNATRLRLDLNGGTTATDRSRIKGDFGIGSSGSQAHSIYIKSNDGVTQNITFRSLGTLTNHEITSNWKRIDLLSTDNSLYFELGIYGNTSYNDTADLLIWGAQVEEGSYPTSYIPNHSGGSVTRNADDCGGAGTSSTFNDTEGVLFIDLKTTKNTSPAQITINDGTYGNRIIFEVRPDAAFIKALINSGGLNVYDASVSSAPNTNYKVAIKYSANDIAFFVNGVKETFTTTTTAMPIGLADISFTGRESDGALRFNGEIKQTLVFNTALSDAECITLTS